MSLFAVLLTIVIAALLLTFIICSHEAGHFFAAKFFHVKVEEFGFGWPPRIWGKRRGETIYSINAIPAGGFVRLLGEGEAVMDDPHSFSAKGPWVRSAIISAGVLANIIVAFFLLTVFVASGNFRTDIPSSIPTTGEELALSFPFGRQTDAVMIDYVIPGSVAEKAGFRSLDEVMSVSGQTFTSIATFQAFVKEKQGQSINFSVYNLLDRTNRNIVATPLRKPTTGQGALGVYLSKVAIVRYQSLPEKIFVGSEHSANLLYFQAKALGALFSQAIKQKTAAPVAQTVSGPVGIVALISRFIGSTGARGFWSLVETVALISLALGVVNILPIPAADGGQLYFSLFEGVTRKKINPNLVRAVNTTGFVILIFLFLLITYNDIMKIFQ